MYFPRVLSLPKFGILVFHSLKHSRHTELSEEGLHFATKLRLWSSIYIYYRVPEILGNKIYFQLDSIIILLSPSTFATQIGPSTISLWEQNGPCIAEFRGVYLLSLWPCNRGNKICSLYLIKLSHFCPLHPFSNLHSHITRAICKFEILGQGQSLLSNNFEVVVKAAMKIIQEQLHVT